MKKNLTITLLSLVALLPVPGFSQKNVDPKEIKDKMQWFADAKLGIFIHAGIYAVDGIDESWSFIIKKSAMLII
jgi:alpha-L-fucosidase